MNQYCYCTLLSSDNYINGVLGLYYSLKKVNTQYPFLVITTNNLSEEIFQILQQNNINYIKKPYLSFSSITNYQSTINKIYIYTLPFKKICFIDADAILLKNIDNYFSLRCPIGYKYWNGEKKIISGGLMFLDVCYNKFIASQQLIKNHNELTDDESVFEQIETNWSNIDNMNYLHIGGLKKYFFNRNFDEIKIFIDNLFSINSFEEKNQYYEIFSNYNDSKNIYFELITKNKKLKNRYEQKSLGAYVTVAFNNSQIQEGIKNFESWKKINSNYMYVIIIIDTIDLQQREKLYEKGIPFFLVPLKYGNYLDKFYLLYLFDFFETIIYIDINNLYLKNYDYLFLKEQIQLFQKIDNIEIYKENHTLLNTFKSNMLKNQN